MGLISSFLRQTVNTMEMTLSLSSLVLCSAAFTISSEALPLPGFRPPAVPLIQNDPYMNIWSFADNLYDAWPTLWDGTTKALTGMIFIDGQAYRFMGPPGPTLPSTTINQINVTVFPTRTVYVFATSSVQLTVTFSSPTVPTDFDLLSMPVTYVSYDVISIDGADHEVSLYYDNSGEIVTNDCASEEIAWNRSSVNGLLVSRFGTTAQNILGMTGDGVGINWGYHFVATADDGTATQVNSADATARPQFASTGTLPTSDDANQPRMCSDNWPVQATAWDLGSVGPSTPQSRWLIFAYDDIASINYFGLDLPPYWRRNGSTTALDMIQQAYAAYPTVVATLVKQDAALLASLNASGGPEYATLTSLAFRQAYAGTKLVWHPKLQTVWVFLKEISSCGCLQTADVIYPAAPLYLWQNAQFVQLLLVPLMAYANNETDIAYNLAWAPHHLGQYPIANIHPSQQENMPVEETANLIILMAAIVQQQNSLDLIYPHYEDLVRSWAQYLVSALPDPGNQLCTDDFEGPSPHNANLAAKGIVGLQAYAYLCTWLNYTDEAAKYSAIVQNYTAFWIQNGIEGNHSRLEYYEDNSWSLKYNWLFQRVLGFSVFPESVIQQDLQYYLQDQQNVYGVPLDNRAEFTKLDWEFWTAALTITTADWDSFVSPIYKWAHETQTRVPLTDWYDTVTGNQQGFQARPVVGGLFAKSLVDSVARK